MNKLELVTQLCCKADINKAESKWIVEQFFTMMADALAQGDRVEIRGLFSLYVKNYDGYTSRNPKTGQKVKVKPKKLPFFKCGKRLKERVDGIV